MTKTSKKKQFNPAPAIQSKLIAEKNLQSSYSEKVKNLDEKLKHLEKLVPVKNGEPKSLFNGTANVKPINFFQRLKHVSPRKTPPAHTKTLNLVSSTPFCGRYDSPRFNRSTSFFSPIVPGSLQKSGEAKVENPVASSAKRLSRSSSRGKQRSYVGTREPHNLKDESKTKVDINVNRSINHKSPSPKRRVKKVSMEKINGTITEETSIRNRQKMSHKEAHASKSSVRVREGQGRQTRGWAPGYNQSEEANLSMNTLKEPERPPSRYMRKQLQELANTESENGLFENGNLDGVDVLTYKRKQFQAFEAFVEGLEQRLESNASCDSDPSTIGSTSSSLERKIRAKRMNRSKDKKSVENTFLVNSRFLKRKSSITSSSDRRRGLENIVEKLKGAAAQKKVLTRSVQTESDMIDNNTYQSMENSSTASPTKSGIRRKYRAKCNFDSSSDSDSSPTRPNSSTSPPNIYDSILEGNEDIPWRYQDSNSQLVSSEMQNTFSHFSFMRSKAAMTRNSFASDHEIEANTSQRALKTYPILNNNMRFKSYARAEEKKIERENWVNSGEISSAEHAEQDNEAVQSKEKRAVSVENWVTAAANATLGRLERVSSAKEKSVDKDQTVQRLDQISYEKVLRTVLVRCKTPESHEPTLCRFSPSYPQLSHDVSSDSGLTTNLDEEISPRSSPSPAKKNASVPVAENDLSKSETINKKLVKRGRACPKSKKNRQKSRYKVSSFSPYSSHCYPAANRSQTESFTPADAENNSIRDQVHNSRTRNTCNSNEEGNQEPLCYSISPFDLEPHDSPVKNKGAVNSKVEVKSARGRKPKNARGLSMQASDQSIVQNEGPTRPKRNRISILEKIHEKITNAGLVLLETKVPKRRKSTNYRRSSTSKQAKSQGKKMSIRTKDSVIEEENEEAVVAVTENIVIGENMERLPPVAENVLSENDTSAGPVEEAPVVNGDMPPPTLRVLVPRLKRPAMKDITADSGIENSVATQKKSKSVGKKRESNKNEGPDTSTQNTSRHDLPGTSYLNNSSSDLRLNVVLEHFINQWGHNLGSERPLSAYIKRDNHYICEMFTVPGNNVKIGLLRMPPGEESPAQTHDECALSYRVKSGKCKVKMNGQTLYPKVNEWFRAAAGEHHSYANVSKKEDLLLIYLRVYMR